MPHLSEEHIALYVDALKRGQTALLPRDLTAHVEECLECKKEIMGLSFAVGDDIKPGTPHPTLIDLRAEEGLRGRKGTISTVAAGMVVVLGLVLFFIIPTGKENHPSGTALSDQRPEANHQQASEMTPRHEALASAHPQPDPFTPSPLLDNTVSENLRAPAATLLYPPNDAAIAFPQHFRWTKALADIPFVFRVIGNDERDRLRATVNDTQYVLSHNLTPGLYYVAIMQESEILCMRRVFVR